jgi:RHS repeat-associated protein
MAARLTRLLVLGLTLGAVLPSPAAAAVVRPPTSQDIAASPVPARGTDAVYASSYFGARYYRADLGRFTTVDPAMTVGENLVDPQRWNRYAYARNNPLRYTDPDGRCIYPGSNCFQYLVGAAKGVLNVVPDTMTQVNRVTNVVIGPLTDFRFTDLPRLSPTNEDQRRGMIAADVTMLFAVAAGAAAPAAESATAAARSVFAENTVGAAEVRILQNGGATITNRTAQALNDVSGLSLNRRDWGRAVEALKKGAGLPNNSHGRITATGDYLDSQGSFIGSLFDYLGPKR